jgi:SAM-dependent methyltransferase
LRCQNPDSRLVAFGNDSNIMIEGRADFRHFLREHLNVYWLRPEVALWRTADALALSGFQFVSPSLDLGCGDGVNSYISAGGRFPLEFDDFLSVKETSPTEFLSGSVDIYDDHPTQSVQISPPPRQIDVGLDWKSSLLAKARSLSLYRQLHQHDANFSLPFADESFQTIFCNILYWIENVNVTLAEMARVLMAGGVAAVLVPNSNIGDYSIFRFVEERGWNWCANLDMGRHSHMRHRLSGKEWEDHFVRAGLRVRQRRTYLSSRLVEIHEIGLRPISPVLIKMAHCLTPENRLKIKKEWLDYLWNLAAPLFETEWITDPSLPQTFHCFLLEKA